MAKKVSMLGALLSFLVTFGCFGPTVSKYVEGSISTKDEWEFVTRFCFLSDHGKMDYEVEYATAQGVHNILLYFDAQWDDVYDSNMNCTEKENALNKDKGQYISLNSLNRHSGCSVFVENGIQKLKCKASRTFTSSRSRWWFIAFSNCWGGKGMELKYKFYLANGPRGDFWYEHFSADEFYILQVDLAFLALYVVMVVLMSIVADKLRQRQLFHTTYKMFMFSVVMEVMHLLFKCIAHGDYATHGRQEYVTWVKVVAGIFEALCLLCFILLVILLAKGYTVTRGRLSRRSTIMVTVFFCVYIVVYVALFINDFILADPAEVLYRYESAAGIGLIVLRVVAWVWFLYAIFFTLKHYPEKACFYYPFLVFYTFWFWLQPVMVLIMSKFVGKWMRAKIANGVDDTLIFVAHIYFLALTWPSKAAKNFPYHVRTTQIGIEQERQDEGDNFPRHKYAPSEPENKREQYEIFTVDSARPNPRSSSRDRSRDMGSINPDLYPHEETAVTS